MWPDAAALKENGRRLRERMEAEVQVYETRYELPSGRLKAALKEGRITETYEICRWLMAIETLRALDRAVES